MKSRQIQIAALAGLLLLLGYVIYSSTRPPAAASQASSIGVGAYQPLAVDNPALRLDLLERLKKLQYEGPHRNIFVATIPPPPTPPKPIATAPAVPAVPPGPPPLTIPATFFGYVADATTGSKRAFFVEGDNVYIVGVGDLLMGRFRLLQIGNSTAELEETSSGRRATLTLEESGPS